MYRVIRLMELTPLVPALYIRLIPVQDCKANFSMCRVIRLKELTPSVPDLYIHDFAIKGDGDGGGRGGRCKFRI